MVVFPDWIHDFPNRSLHKLLHSGKSHPSLVSGILGALLTQASSVQLIGMESLLDASSNEDELVGMEGGVAHICCRFWARILGIHIEMQNCVAGYCVAPADLLGTHELIFFL
jgi:hypothetical protein